MKTRKQNIESIIEDIQALKRKMIAEHTHRLHAKDVLTPSQMAVFALLAKQKGMNLKEIAAALGITGSAATQLVNGLVKKGYLLRTQSPEDRRAVILTLSPRSTARLAEMKSKHTQHLTSLFKSLSDTELTTYAKLNKKIVTGLKYGK